MIKALSRAYFSFSQFIFRRRRKKKILRTSACVQISHAHTQINFVDYKTWHIINQYPSGDEAKKKNSNFIVLSKNFRPTYTSQPASHSAPPVVIKIDTVHVKTVLFMYQPYCNVKLVVYKIVSLLRSTPFILLRDSRYICSFCCCIPCCMQILSPCNIAADSVSTNFACFLPINTHRAAESTFCQISVLVYYTILSIIVLCVEVTHWTGQIIHIYSYPISFTNIVCIRNRTFFENNCTFSS